MDRRVTMKDIAKSMGVSTVTVSKALTGREGVSEEVREKIKEKAEKMGYRYHSAARAMRNGSSYNIGVLLPERFFSDDAFYSKMYEYIVREAADRGYFTVFEILSDEDERNNAVPKMISGGKVDGMIALGQVSSQYAESIAGYGVPYIFLDFYDEHSGIDAVVGDNVYGGYLMTGYLLDMGIRNIAFVGSIKATSSILDRYLGYYKALIERGIPLRDDWIIPDRDENGEFIDLRLPDAMPEAFFCNCDSVAYNLVEKLKNNGYMIPQDVSVIGYDDYLFSRICNPPLTTFKVDIERMGRTAVETIVRKVDTPSIRMGRIVINGELVIRDSVKKKK